MKKNQKSRCKKIFEFLQYLNTLPAKRRKKNNTFL